MKARCPNDPSHKTFVTSAHEMHDWVVDEDGDFITDLGCIQVSFGPDPDNTWACRTCGAQAEVES